MDCGGRGGGFKGSTAGSGKRLYFSTVVVGVGSACVAWKGGGCENGGREGGGL